MNTWRNLGCTREKNLGQRRQHVDCSRLVREAHVKCVDVCGRELGHRPNAITLNNWHLGKVDCNKQKKKQVK